MPGKLNLYNLGDLGVDLVQSPAHTPAGSYSAAQNAVVRTVAGNHGIAKRAGMTKLNATAAAGAILAIANIPLADQSPVAVFSPVGSGGWQATSNGTTWAADASTSEVVHATDLPRNGLAYYLSNLGGAVDTVRSFDGDTRTTVIALASFPANGQGEAVTLLRDIRVRGSSLFIMTSDGGTRGRVLRYDLVSGTFTQQGQTIGGTAAHATVIDDKGDPYTCEEHQFRVYVATRPAGSGNNGRIFALADWDRTEWTEEHDLGSTDEHVCCFGVHKDFVLAGTNSIISTNCHIFRRATSGVWSSVFTSVPSGFSVRISWILSFNGNVYAGLIGTSNTTFVLVSTDDGATWSQAAETTSLADTFASFSTNPMRGALVFENALLVAGRLSSAGVVIRSTNGSTWSTVVTHDVGAFSGIYSILGI